MHAAVRQALIYDPEVTGSSATRFDPARVATLAEPVRRYFTHAIEDGAPLGGTQIQMRGRVKAGVWLPFTAEERCDGRSFDWDARVRLGPLRLLDVHDGYAAGIGATKGRLFGRLGVFGARDEHTTRSAAGRAALESVVFSPASVLPEHGVEWRATGHDEIVARFDLPPERPEVTVRLDRTGAIQSAYALRWSNVGRTGHDYLRCGCTVHAEERFGPLVIPSSLTVSWGFGTPREAPFFEAELTSVESIAPGPRPA